MSSQRRSSFFGGSKKEEPQAQEKPAVLDLVSLDKDEKDEKLGSPVAGPSSPRKAGRGAKDRSVEISSHRLRTGDVVYFSFAQQPGEGIDQRDGGFLTAEGFADPRVGLRLAPSGATPQHFHQCLFRIVSKMNYEAKESFQKFERKMEKSKKDVSTSSQKQQVTAELQLKREKVREERERNIKRMTQQNAELVYYNQLVQLQHVHSGKFLCTKRSTLAEMEKENHRLELEEDGSEAAWFRFKPRFKIRSPTGFVYLNDQVTIVNYKLKEDNFAVHAGERRFEDDSRSATGALQLPFEANLSNRAKDTAFRLLSYSQSKGEVEAEAQHQAPGLQYGSVIRLYHPEAEAFVSGTCNRNLLKLPYLMRQSHEDHEHPVNVRAKSLFRLEAVERSAGGAVEWQDEVRLCHVCTGKYLTVSYESSCLPEGRDEELREEKISLSDRAGEEGKYRSEVAGLLYGAVLSDEEQLERQTFVLTPVTMSGKQEDRRVHLDDLNLMLKHVIVDEDGETVETLWLHNTKAAKESEAESSAVTEEGGSGRVGLKLGFCTSCLDQDAVMLMLTPRMMVEDVYQVLGSFPVIESYCQRVADSFAVSATMGGGGGLTRELAAPMMALLDTMIRFCLTRDGEEMREGRAMDLEGPPVLERQVIMRETKFLDLLFYALTQPERAGYSFEQLSMPKLNTYLFKVHRMLYRCATLAFLHNTRNEMYVALHDTLTWTGGHSVAQLEYGRATVQGATAGSTAPYMDEVIHQLGYDLGAAECLRSLLNNNKKLLMEKVDEDTVNIFVTLIRTKGPKAIFTRFLSALCCVNEESIVMNQEHMLRVMYSVGGTHQNRNVANRRKLLVETALDTASSTRKWVSKSDQDELAAINKERREKGQPLLPNNHVFDHGEYLCGHLASEGMHQVVVSWAGAEQWAPGNGDALFWAPSKLGFVAKQKAATTGGLAYLESGEETKGVQCTQLQAYLAQLSSNGGAGQSDGGGSRRQWVTLEDLCQFADANGGRRDDSVSDDEDAAAHGDGETIFTLRAQISDYYLSLLELFSEMCVDSSLNCLQYLEKQFTYEILVTAITNTKLTDGFRTAFASLMLRVYLDRFPHEEMRAPNLVRVWDEITSCDVEDEDALPQYRLDADHVLRNHPEPFYSHPDADKFHLLMDFISDHFDSLNGRQVVENRSQNHLTLMLLSCLRVLAKCGFYSTTAKIADLVDPLIDALDGRADCITRREAAEARRKEEKWVKSRRASAVVAPARGGMGGFLKGGGGGVRGGKMKRFSSAGPEISEEEMELDAGSDDVIARYKLSEENLLVMKSKVQMCFVLGSMSDIRLDYRISVMLDQMKGRIRNQVPLHAKFEDASADDEPLEKHMRVIRPPTIAANEGIDLSVGGLAGGFASLASGAVDSLSTLVTGDDAEVDRRADAQNGSSLTHYGLRFLFGADGSGGLFGEETKELDMDLISDAPLVTVCLDLMMYDDDSLLEAAFRTLVRHFSQEEAFITSLRKVQLLSTRESMDAYKVLQQELSVLQNNMESFEIWGVANDFSDVDMECVEQVKATLTKIRHLCSFDPDADTSEMMVGGDGPEPHSENQELLRNMGVHEIIFEGLRIPSEADFTVAANRTGNLFEIKQLCIAFVDKFIDSAPANQELVFAQLDLLLDHVGMGLRVETVAAHVFKGNRKLCTQLPRQLVLQFVRQINRKSPSKSVPLLEFFKDTICPAGEPVKSNQTLVLKTLTDAEYNSTPLKQVCLLLTDGEGSSGIGDGVTKSSGAHKHEDMPGYQERLRLMRHFDVMLDGRPREGQVDLTPAVKGALAAAKAQGGEDPEEDPEDIKATNRLIYHCTVMELLSSICRGKSSTTEVKCQELLSLSLCLEVLGDFRPELQGPNGRTLAGALFVKRVFLGFLTEVYVDTEITEYEELGADLRFWRLMKQLCAEVQAFLQEAKGPHGEPAHGAADIRSERVQVEHGIAKSFVFDGFVGTLAALSKNRKLLDAHRELSYDSMVAAGDDVGESVVSVKGALKSLLDASAEGVFGHDADYHSLLVHCAVGLGMEHELAAEDFSAMHDSGVSFQLGGGGKGRGRKSTGKALRGSLSSMVAEGEEFEDGSPREELKTLIEAIDSSHAFNLRMERSFANLVDAFENVAVLTDKADAGFVLAVENLIKQGMLTDRNGQKLHPEKLEQAFADKRSNKVTTEMLTRRLCAHVCGQIRKAGRVTDVTLMCDAMELLRKLLESHEGYDDKFIDEQGINPDDVKSREEGFVQWQVDLNNWGVTAMIVDVISAGSDDRLTVAVMELAVVLLQGGNLHVQTTLYEYLTSEKNYMFFQHMKDRIRRAVGAVKAARKKQKAQETNRQSQLNMVADMDALKGDDDDEFDPISMDVVGRMLQLFAEGHNLKMQRLMRDQSELGFRFSYDLVSEAVTLLQASAKNQMAIREMDSDSAEDVGKVLDFLIEVTQGPCSENQDLLASSGMVDVCKAIMEADFRRADPDNAKEVKANAVTALTALLEGRHDRTVHSILSEKLDPRSVRDRLTDIYQYYKKHKQRLQDAGEDEEYLAEGFDLLTMADALGKTSPKFDKKHLEPDPAKLKKPDPTRYDKKKTNKLKSDMKVYEREKEYKETYSFFKERIRTIEIYWNKQIQRITFPMQSECDFITESIKEKLKDEIDYTDDDKVDEFLEKSLTLQTELKHFEYLNRFGFYRYLGRNLEAIKQLSFALALMMNFIMVISLEKVHTPTGNVPEYHPKYMREIQFGLGLMQLLTSCLVLIFKLLNLAPLVYKRVLLRRKKLIIGLSSGSDFADQAREHAALLYDAFRPLVFAMAACFCIFGLLYARFTDSISYGVISGVIVVVGSFIGAQSLRKLWGSPLHEIAFWYSVGYDTLTSSDTMFYVIYALCAVLGVYGYSFFYCFHLLDLVLMSLALQNVVRSVTSPIVALGMTTVLTLFAVYIFSLVGFYAFDGDFYNADAGVDECGTMILCFFTFIHNGLLPGGGIGDYMSFELGWQPFNAGDGFYDDYNYALRLMFDMFFFIGVLILLLNIIFGIILDTFSELREEANEEKKIMTGKCFVCGIDKGKFDDDAMKNGEQKGFLRHIAIEHNMWDYLFFIMFLHNKDETEFTGAETYVQNCLDTNDMKWVPQNRALCFDDDEDDDSFEEVVLDTTVEIKALTRDKVKEVDDTVKDLTRRIKDTLATSISSVQELEQKVEEIAERIGRQPGHKSNKTSVF